MRAPAQEMRKLRFLHLHFCDHTSGLNLFSRFGESQRHPFLHFLPERGPKPEEEEDLEPHEERGRREALHETVHQSRLPFFEDGMARMELHVPTEKMGGNGGAPGLRTPALPEEAGRHECRSAYAESPAEPTAEVEPDIVQRIEKSDTEGEIGLHELSVAALRARGGQEPPRERPEVQGEERSRVRTENQHRPGDHGHLSGAAHDGRPGSAC